MRTIVWMFISTLLAVTAVHGLGISSRHFARQETPATSEIEPGLVDNDGGEDHGGMEPSRYAR